MTGQQKVVLTAGLVITALGVLTTIQMFLWPVWPSFWPFVLIGVGIVITLAAWLPWDRR
jgi:MFS superfamily sulfate permease-like transporter